MRNLLFFASIVVSNLIHAGELPRCEDISLEQSQVDAAVHAQVQQNHDDSDFALGKIALDTATALGCRINDPPVDPIFVGSFDTRNSPTRRDCTNWDYCPDVGYCGKGNGTTSIWTVRPSDTLNVGCWEHDGCYAGTCIENNGFCAFANNNVPQSACDAELLGTCADVVFDRQAIRDYLICNIVTALRLRSPPECADDGGGGTLASSWTASYQETAGACILHGGSFAMDLTQGDDTYLGVVHGTLHLSTGDVPVYGQRTCNTTFDDMIWKPNAITPRGRGLMLQSQEGWSLTLWGRFAGDNLHSPASSVDGFYLYSIHALPEDDPACAYLGIWGANGY